MNQSFMGVRGGLFVSTFALSVLAICTGACAQTSSKPVTASAKPLTLASMNFHEDWGSITLAGSTLIPQTPLMDGKDDAPGSTYIRVRYQMQWRPHDPFDLFVVLPKGVTKPPVILYLYSFPQDSERNKDDAWCTFATSGGYAAVGFVSALTGHRVNGSRPMKEWFVSEFQESLATSTHDVQMILNYLKDRGDLDMDHIGMFGQGSGGSIAILASAADPRIKSVDVLTPWGDWPNWLAKSPGIPQEERAKYLTPEFLASVAPLEPASWLPKMKARSIRIQNVRKDPAMPDESQLKIEGAAPVIAEINQYGDGGALVPNAAGGRIFDWLKAELKPDAVPATVAGKSERVHFYPPAARPHTQP